MAQTIASCTFVALPSTRASATLKSSRAFVGRKVSANAPSQFLTRYRSYSCAYRSPAHVRCKHVSALNTVGVYICDLGGAWPVRRWCSGGHKRMRGVGGCAHIAA
eukprot:198776-Prorocentrum_minimum.AAC.3